MEQIEKCRTKMNQGDYDGAITNARSLVEAVLAAMEKEFDAAAPDYDGDLPKLYKRVQKHLKLSPENPKISSSPCAPGWLTIIKDARTPAWGLQFLKHLSRDLCHILNCTGTGCHLIVRFERRTFCMDFITNTHGKTVPHDGGRGFCGAQLSLKHCCRGGEHAVIQAAVA